MSDTEKYAAALEVEFWAEDRGAWTTLRMYLADLLLAVVAEGEGFSGKRPFGNSGWEGFAAVPLITVGLIKGKIEGAGEPYASEYDRRAMDKVLPMVIAHLLDVDLEKAK